LLGRCLAPCRTAVGTEACGAEREAPAEQRERRLRSRERGACGAEREAPAEQRLQSREWRVESKEHGRGSIADIR